MDLLKSRDVVAIGVRITDGYLCCGILLTRLDQLTSGILYDPQSLEAYPFECQDVLTWGESYNVKLRLITDNPKGTL